jgi:hypothetical protein
VPPGFSVSSRSLWQQLHRRPRRAIEALRKREIPEDPGVYALYRDGEPVYVGKAKSLQSRIWKSHCGRGKVMTGSAMRRNVAELLDIATAADIKARRHRPTPTEVKRVRVFLDTCEIAWRSTTSEEAAIELEKSMKREWLPPLTKR